ncbi:MAG: hypothetical protein COV55_03960 [Candidatus Komeilibacteria bacterium CG11_big_fil_rev_8_21_14_0_20_36_20]|uniref:Glycosyltransferase 2-like domain-containing protein n=1 Tax=Candidatus Komeilibacteria bacterium CG11_big_fil_rev_8_21_14_0_20_36_20 TaxID=1974477 RepID=A0A2H0NBY5_9BACT|nr:MAG: hypothetical protein COV55_03960 [Candidatus Komeilibacteria bacterium CG11_big_fil_rev_8_21_14_0_20_36_20]PIR81986.1 MAG: hypothetical protein COU21_00595 [Candidatus Komeilibacteria bacterium CG10_big_fil_rev_8_21_14_0_10_36_65]PJC55524.1 MAG: hypothetical protein CO027_01600 [Candidatus Komeilibacteria bacterium CG_4_9_14_0_2_um_filter_36_13]
MAKRAKVTVSLLTWNGAEYLPWLLKSLKEQSFPNWELLVLDNASTDQSVAVVLEYYPQARIIRQKKNVGFAKGHNLLIGWSNSNYILLLNQDIILEPDYLEKTVNFLEKNSQVAAVAGKTMYWDFKEEGKTSIIDSFGLKINRQRQVIDAHQGQKDFEFSDKEVFGLSAAVVLLRRESLESIKIPRSHDYFEYLDEDFFAYKEDIDLAWRLRLFGWENWLITNTRAYHHRSVASAQNIRESRKTRQTANRLSYRNHFITLYKNSFVTNILRDFWPILWYESRKFFYFLLFERSTLAGCGEFIKNLPKMRAKRKLIKKNRQIKASEVRQWFK